MFGFGKNKQKQKDDKFLRELAELTSSFAYNADFLDDQQVREIMETVTAVYLERDPEEANYQTADFFFNSLIGNIASNTINDQLDPHLSLQMWRRTDKYLLTFPSKNTDIAQIGMQNWKGILINRGIDPMNFEVLF
ncbi:hypothetical protein [Neptuniibacter marinus]|uniref:hypothetical protein n=1 Tax=Neptuniibacter marinus TaxID=1806670 RepID=UPI003B5AD83C